MNIVLQPVANMVAQRHLAKTVFNPFLLTSIASYIGPNDLANLKSIYTDGKVRVWGIKSKNTSRYNKLSRGDLVLFCAHNVISAYGEIDYIIRSPELAMALWGNDKDGETWENIYFLSNVKDGINIPKSKVNEALGYERNYNVQGFNVVSDLGRIASFWRDFDYSDGILSPKDKGKTASTLRSILQLLEHSGNLTFEQIANGLDCDEKSLEILLNGGIMGGLFEVLPDGKYTIKK